MIRPAPYLTLDDAVTLDMAATSPASLLAAYPQGAVIDEAQRTPGLFRTLKAAVDKDRTPGKWLVTGSANLLLLPKLSESLAGRMETIDLWPLSQGEIEGKREGFLTWAFEGGQPPPVEPAMDWQERVSRGGFPEPSGRPSASRREAWFASYVRALVERDVRDIAQVDGVVLLPRLLRALAADPYGVVNATALSRSTGIPPTSVGRYLGLLEAVYLVRNVPAWSGGGDARVAKSPRVALVDSGVADHLGASRECLDNFVAMELMRQCSYLGEGHRVCHFRSARQYSLPAVVANAKGRCVGISVVPRESLAPADLQALKFFQGVAGNDFIGGVAFHLGQEVAPLGDGLWSMPLSALWRL